MKKILKIFFRLYLWSISVNMTLLNASFISIIRRSRNYLKQSYKLDNTIQMKRRYTYPTTHLHYYEDTYLDGIKSKVKVFDKDENGSYIIPLITIFHPQGGGQPSDEGSIIINGEPWEVTNLVQESRGVRHYISSTPQVKEGQDISMKIDFDKRFLYAKYHTAGHLISNILEFKYKGITAYKGNHFPGESAVTFQVIGKEPPISKQHFISYNINELKDFLELELEKQLNLQLNVKSEHSEHGRIVKIGDFCSYSCGGTHVNNINEIGKIVIGKVKIRNSDGLKVSYSLI